MSEGGRGEQARTIGGYTLTGRVLGKGGFGVVYEGKHETLERLVAIKVQAEDSSTSDTARLIEEAKLVARLRHPNIVDLFDIGTLPDGRAYLVMEMLEGVTLQAHLAAVTRMTMGAALPLLRGLASALDAIHAKGFAHRDVKPANVMLVRDHDNVLHAKLLDFGIAKAIDPALAHQSLTGTGMMIGTPPYMSPEQCRGDRVQPASDIYALGVVAYRMLTGELPFDGAPVDIYHAHVYDPPPPPSSRAAAVDASLDQPLLAMLAKQPEQRPSSASAAIDALCEPSPARSEQPTVRARSVVTGLEPQIEIQTEPTPRSRRGRIAAITVAGVAALAVAAYVVATRSAPAVSEAARAPTPSPSMSAPARAPVAAVPLDAAAAPVAVEAPAAPPDAPPPSASAPVRGSGHRAPNRGSATKRNTKDDLESLPDAYRNDSTP